MLGDGKREAKRTAFEIFREILHFEYSIRFGYASPIKAVNRFILKQIMPDFSALALNVDDFKMFINRTDPQGPTLEHLADHYEVFETHLFKNMIQKGDTIFDLGAHIGYYTIIYSKTTGKDGMVYAFEPESENFSFLLKNIDLNCCLDNIRPVMKAASDVNGQEELYLSPIDKGDYRLYDSGDNRKSVAIDSVRLDDYTQDSQRSADIIKMDIQGSEFKAMRGAKRILDENRDHIKIVSEFSPYMLKKAGEDPADYLEYLLSYGLSVYDIHDWERTLEKMTVKKIMNKYDHGQHFTNLLFIRDEQIPEL